MDDDVTCTITNDDVAPTLKLVKSVTNDNGGTTLSGGWDLTATGSVLGFTDKGDSTTFHTVKAGVEYTLTESSVPGYSAGSWSCNGGTLSTDKITLGLDDDVTCTITNDDVAPKLTLVKDPTNDDGGNALPDDFKLTIGGTAAISGTAYTLEANKSYTINETQLTGYTFTSITGDKKCPTTLGGSITLAPGDDITCTITNDDQKSSITLIKQVINNNGGTAGVNEFGLSIGGTDVVSGEKLVLKSNESYIIDEVGLDGYHYVSLNGNKCPDYLGGTVELKPGENIVCTITNDDQPGTLIVKKVVINDNGGTLKPEDFAFKINNSNPTSFESDGQNNISVDAGSYTIVEPSVLGYKTTYNNCNNVIISNGKTETCVITNDDTYGKVVVTKYNDINGNGKKDVNEKELDGWDINLSNQTKTTDLTGVVTFSPLLSGEYSLGETQKPGWKQTEIICDNQDKEPTSTPTPISTSTPTPPLTGTPTPTSTPTPTLKGLCHWNEGSDKWNALYVTINNPGHIDHTKDFPYNGPRLANGHPTKEGDLWCLNNDPNQSRLSKLLGISKVFAQENYDDLYYIDLKPEQTVYCYIGNQRLEPKLTISKFNNVTGNLSPGGAVEYTIDLGIAQNDIKNLKVTDLLSNGFKYKTGSYKIYLDSLDVTSQVAEPQYHSPGVWDLSSLGTLTPENKLRLVYTADISTDQQPGKYTDLAWAAANYAYNDSEKLLALAEDVGKVDDNFVGTIVPIVKNTQNSVSAEVEQKVEGTVLGASTELPGTGASTLWLILSSILGFVGLGVLKINKKNMFILLFALFSFGLMVKPAIAADFVLSIQEPKTPTNTKDLKLEFKALHLNNGIITAKCLKKGPTDSVFSQFGSNIVLTAGGNSSYCDLSLAINNNGTYQFTVEANDGVDTTSKNVSLDYNTSSPGTPRDYRKENINSNNCDFKIHFRTDADNGKTVKVELYRSTDSAFSVNNESLVSSVNIGSDQEYDLLNSVPDCSKTYYYALRAFDNAGNGSGLIGDKITITTTTTSETTVNDGNQGAIPVVNAKIPSEESQTDSNQNTSTSDQTGQVLGTQKSTVADFVGKHKFISTLIGVSVLSIIIYAIKKNRKNKKR